MYEGSDDTFLSKVVPPSLQETVARGLERAFDEAEVSVAEAEKAKIAVETLEELHTSDEFQTPDSDELEEKIRTTASEIIARRHGLPADVRELIQDWVHPDHFNTALSQAQRNQPWVNESLRDVAATSLHVIDVTITDAYIEYQFSTEGITASPLLDLRRWTGYDLRWATTPADAPLDFEFEYEFHLPDSGKSHKIYTSIAGGELVHLASIPFHPAEVRNQPQRLHPFDETELGVETRSMAKSCTDRTVAELTTH